MARQRELPQWTPRGRIGDRRRAHAARQGEAPVGEDAAMADDPDFEYVMIDSTIVRAHQHAAGKKGGLKLVRSAARAAG